MGYAELTMSQKAMYDESRVERLSTGVSMHLPRISDLQRKYPHYTFDDDDWREVARCLKDFALNKLPEPSNVIPFPVPTTDVDKGTRVRARTRGASTVPVSSEVEARVRELSGERLIQVAASNGVEVAIHPTNPGITAMRRKNALLTLFRHGAAIKNL
jgi:hypothetical protein